MGLDMYLYRVWYIGAKWSSQGAEGTLDIKIKGKTLPIKFSRVDSIQEEVAYWRKEYPIHDWFVDHIFLGVECFGEREVSSEELRELRDACSQVLDKAIVKENSEALNVFDEKVVENAAEIEKILPASTGNYFGSITYNKAYLDGISRTLDYLNAILEEDEKIREAGFAESDCTYLYVAN